MPLRVVIVDDEKHAVQELKYLIQQYSDFEICGVAYNAEDCLNVIASERPDVAFLDIHLGSKNGIDLANEIKKIYKDIHIVFATAYDNYAVNAFDLNAVDYILKPFDDYRILQTIERLKSMIKPRPRANVISVWDKDRMHLLTPDQIVYCSTGTNKVIVKSLKGEFTTSLTLANLENKLDSNTFIRTHKSYIVNINHIKQIVPWFNYTYLLVMEKYEKDEVPVSRSYMKKFKEMLGI
ncbi:MAG: LytTR family transcriptional regulator DNA-binding domain-containing protein [Clostridia bacterium]|nr:LytTR family transcriptional regulator DNA-binding domain-containing protein [Clostridia bacterium]